MWSCHRRECPGGAPMKSRECPPSLGEMLDGRYLHDVAPSPRSDDLGFPSGTNQALVAIGTEGEPYWHLMIAITLSPCCFSVTTSLCLCIYSSTGSFDTIVTDFITLYQRSYPHSKPHHIMRVRPRDLTTFQALVLLLLCESAGR